MRLSRCGLIVLASFLCIGEASASSFSFTGTFIQDDQLELFQFLAPSASVTLATLGYGGGVNAAGATIAAGGLDPVLSLFDATNGLSASSPLIAQDSAGGAGNMDPDTGLMADELLTLTNLNPTHTYVLVLSEYDNLAAGATYGDGFTKTGQGNFTPNEFGCSGTAFCDPTASQRTGAWAVDITGVSAASDITAGATPEPASILLIGTGFAGLALSRRRKNNSLI